MISLDASFAPGIAMRIDGPGGVLRHFAAEYEPALVPSAEGGLHVRFTDQPPASDAMVFTGGYKTVRWRVGVVPTPSPSVTIDLRGYPRSFGLSLCQGYFVEPLLSLVAIDAGSLLLPASGIVHDGGVLLLLGRSGSGKSTLSARALAAGHTILGDDQVFVDGLGMVRAFPRRLRFYADLPRTAPEAYAKLPSRTRWALLGRRVGVAATRGFVAPPVRVPVVALGPPSPQAATPLVRAVVIERGIDVDGLQIDHPRVEQAVDLALGIIDQQRGKLTGSASPVWLERLALARRKEASVLLRALEVCTIERVRVPRAWDAKRATEAVGRALEITLR